MQSKWIDIDKVELWEENPRINEHVVEQVAVSIAEFGFLNPLIVQKKTNKIIAGNTRYKAALKLNLPKVPVIYTDLDDNKATAFAIADNKLGELAMWDEDLLKDLLVQIEESDVNIEVLGFDEYELDSILNDDIGETSLDLEEEIKDLEDNATDKISITCPLSKLEEIKETIETALMGYDGITIR